MNYEDLEDILREFQKCIVRMDAIGQHMNRNVSQLDSAFQGDAANEAIPVLNQYKSDLRTYSGDQQDSTLKVVHRAIDAAMTQFRDTDRLQAKKFILK